jgi:hypothetical protein
MGKKLFIYTRLRENAAVLLLFLTICLKCIARVKMNGIEDKLFLVDKMTFAGAKLNKSKKMI